MNKLNEENLQNMALATLADIWSQIDFDKVTGQRAIGIWDEFASKVKAAAMTTNKYETFVEKLCKKMDIRSLKFNNIREISNESTEIKEAILNVFRNETQIIILKLRLNNKTRKEEVKKRKIAEEKFEKYNEELDNKQVNFIEKGVKIIDEN